MVWIPQLELSDLEPEGCQAGMRVGAVGAWVAGPVELRNWETRPRVTPMTSAMSETDSP